MFLNPLISLFTSYDDRITICPKTSPGQFFTILLTESDLESEYQCIFHVNKMVKMYLYLMITTLSAAPVSHIKGAFTQANACCFSFG